MSKADAARAGLQEEERVAPAVVGIEFLFALAINIGGLAGVVAQFNRAIAFDGDFAKQMNDFAHMNIVVLADAVQCHQWIENDDVNSAPSWPTLHVTSPR